VRKHNKAKPPVRNFRRFTTTVALVSAIVAIGAISVLSRQKGETGKTSALASKAQIVNSRVASQDQKLESQAQPQELTADEAQQLGAGLKDLVNQSTDGLVEVHHPDGTVSMDLDDRFQNVTVARVNKDGSISQSCVDNPKAAGAFFGIDPKLIDPTVEGDTQPTKVSPARSN
jgi:hypothetical protein